MKERPILFTGEMVRAILDGRKTQTRRPVTNQKHPYGTWATPEEVVAEFLGGTCAFSAPLGTVGARLWVKEVWRPEYENDTGATLVRYRCDGGSSKMCGDGSKLWLGAAAGTDRWRASLHMPRWASRIDLEITAVRVERVQDITEEDARKEGVSGTEWTLLAKRPNAEAFRDLWQSIYGAWDANPWVWAYEFRRVRP